MNYIKHLNTFLMHVSQDKRLTSGHVSLYIALFNQWNMQHFTSPIITNREKLMSVSAIGSKNTYLKCMKDLHDYGYIIYQPGNLKFKKSRVRIIQLKEEDFKNYGTENDPNTISNMTHNSPTFNTSPKFDCPKYGNEPGPYLTLNDPKFDTATGPNVGTYNKQTNNINIAYSTKEIFNKNKIEDKKNILPSGPDLGQVKDFFSTNNYPEIEANKFFQFYQSIGWLAGGKTPITNWQAAAHKWILNSHQIKNSKLNDSKSYLHLPKIEDYSEPF